MAVPCPVPVPATGGLCAPSSGLAGGMAGSLAGAGMGSMLDAVGSWVAGAASWLLRQVGAVLGSTTRIDLGAPWFATHAATMAALAGVVVLPMLLAGIIQAVFRQQAGALIRSVLVNLPLAMLLTAVAIQLVQLGLSVTDSLSAVVAGHSAADTAQLLGPVSTALNDTAVAGPGVPAFVLLLGSLLVVLGALLLWVELLVREAAVYVAVLFLPLALAALVWPAVSHWARRLVDTLAALILAKFVIVAVLALAAGELAHARGFAAVLGGAALLLLAGFAPWSLFRLIPALEAGAVSHLEGTGRQVARNATGPTRSLAHAALGAAQVAGLGPGGAAGAGGMAAGAGGAAGEGSAGAGGAGGAGGGGSPSPGGPPAGSPDSGGAIGRFGTVPEAAAEFDAAMAGPDPASPAPVPGAGGPTPSGGGVAAAASAPSPQSRPPVVLPRSSGSNQVHVMGADHLGPRLEVLPGPAGGGTPGAGRG